MKRTKKKKTKKGIGTVNAILTSDWHLREDTPVCRTDDFEAAQWDKVRQVSDLQKKYDCPVLHAGDLFHHWKPSPELLSKTIKNLPRNFQTVYGNHDLPQHSMDLAHKSGVNTLATGDHITLLKEGHWNIPPDKGFLIRYYDAHEEIHGRIVGVWHKYVYTYKKPFPGVTPDEEGHRILKDFPDFDLLVTGDNHQSFVCKQDDRILVNPGSLTRQTSDQEHFEPCVYLYSAGENEVEAHYLDINEEAISREHLEKKEERDERISAFVERLGTEWEGDLNFNENMKRFAKTNKIDNKVMEIAYKALEQ